ncbi:MAG: dienelactone hydrolase family protein [Actinomycetota bacterium]|nr:dienelactone hydrolase family protein [Actinomycetota bacterium]
MPGTGAVYAKPGPFQAGTMTAALADGRRVVIWYPAASSAAKAPRETLDIASLLTPALQAKVPAELRHKIQYSIDAHVGAAPARDGPFPVVLFSHGYAGFPEQSADLTTHLARWGFVVVAPDHVERSLDGLLGTAAQGVKKKLTDAQVLSQSLDLALMENHRSGSPLEGLVDASKVAVIGQSAGAGAAYATASTDRRIKSFIAYSVGLGGPGGQPVPPPPKVPGMVMVGTADGVIPIADNRKVYRGMRPPKYLVTFRNAGHNVFSDICEIGKSEGGLVALVHQIKLAIPASLLRLASDGCQPNNLDPRQAFPAIDHLSVAFLRSTLGVDHAPVGLDPQVTTAFPAAGIVLSHAG